jgi:hypothetical protein
MSDYLSTLAARSLRLLPTVTPRLTSLFEPSPRAGGSLAVPTAPPVEPAASRPPAPPSVVRDVPERADAREARPASRPAPIVAATPALRARDETDARPRPAIVRVEDVRPSAPVSMKAERTPQAEPLPVVPPRREQPRDEMPMTLPVRQDHRRDASEPADLTQRHIARPDGMRIADERLTALERQVLRDRGAPRELQAGEGTPPVVRPAIVPVTTPALAHAARPATDVTSAVPASPAVHVTIGRIDVRAVMPPAASAPRRAAPVSSGMSLEQYLKQRHGDER